MGEPAYRNRTSDKVALMAEIAATVRPTPKAFGVDVGPLEDVLAKALTTDTLQRWQHAKLFSKQSRGRLPRSTAKRAGRAEYRWHPSVATYSLGLPASGDPTTIAAQPLHSTATTPQAPSARRGLPGESNAPLVAAVPPQSHVRAAAPTIVDPYRVGLPRSFAPTYVVPPSTTPHKRLLWVAAGMGLALSVGAVVLGLAMRWTPHAPAAAPQARPDSRRTNVSAFQFRRPVQRNVVPTAALTARANALVEQPPPPTGTIAPTVQGSAEQPRRGTGTASDRSPPPNAASSRHGARQSHQAPTAHPNSAAPETVYIN